MWWNFELPAGDWAAAHESFHASVAVDDAEYVRSMLEAESQWEVKWDRLGVHVWVGRTIASKGSGGFMSLSTHPSRVVIVPAWLIAGLSLALPSAWAGRRCRIHWLRASNLCKLRLGPSGHKGSVP